MAARQSQVVVACGLSVAVLVAVPPAQAVVDEGETNAAVWYEEALAQFHEPAEDVKREIKGVVAKGWTGDHPRLEEHLQQSAAAIDLFKRGARLAVCDFWKGRSLPEKGIAAATAKLPYPPNLGELVRTVLLEG